MKAPSKEKALEFEAPARQKITQEIPIVNNSDKDWVINAKYTGDTSNFKGKHKLEGQNWRRGIIQTSLPGQMNGLAKRQRNLHYQTAQRERNMFSSCAVLRMNH